MRIEIGGLGLSERVNITFRSGKKLNGYKTTGRFTTEKINKKYLAAAYYNGYKIPKL